MDDRKVDGMHPLVRKFNLIYSKDRPQSPAGRNILEELNRIWEDYLKVPLEELERDISSINYYRNKAKFIKSACQMIAEEYGGKVPD